MLGEALSRRTSFTVLQGRRNVGGKGHLPLPPILAEYAHHISTWPGGRNVWKYGGRVITWGGIIFHPWLRSGGTPLVQPSQCPFPRIFIPSAGSLTYWHSAVRSLIFVPKSEGIAEAFCLSPTVNWQAGCCIKANSRNGSKVVFYHKKKIPMSESLFIHQSERKSEHLHINLIFLKGNVNLQICQFCEDKVAIKVISVIGNIFSL